MPWDALVLLFCCILPAQVLSQTTNTSAVRGTSNGNAPPGIVSKIPTRTLLYPGATTKIFVRYMPWFGDPKHIDIGYRSDDPSQIHRQVDDMVSRGIDGAIVDWYGPNDSLKNRSTQMLLKEAERHSGFLFAVSVDKKPVENCEKNGCDPVRELASLVNYVVDHFASSPAYWKINSRPVITFFGLEKRDLDWHSIRQHSHGNPMFIFRNSGGFSAPESDGAFAWIAPETASGADPMGLEYLRRFYRTAQKNSEKLTIGSAYKGFDDSAASWSKHHKIDQRCGLTWLTTFSVANEFYSRKHQLDALIIPTWNDYEEGTAIEPGIDNCVQLKTRLDGNQLRIELSGSRDTVDHLSVDTGTTANISHLADLPSDTKNFRLPRSISNARATAVGKPSILNQGLSVAVPQSHN